MKLHREETTTHKHIRAEHNDGFSIVEILIAAAIISVIGVMSFLSTQMYLRMSFRNSTNMQIANLFEETAEVVQFMRDQGWEENIADRNLETPYYLYWENNAYNATTTETFANGFAKSFLLSEVLRNANDQIASTGTLDPNTRLVTIEIKWTDRDGTSQNNQTQMLIHNNYEN